VASEAGGARGEAGQGLLELVIAMSFIALAVGGLVSMMVASAASLQRSDEKGTALTLADRQLELYRTMSYANIRLSKASIDAIPASDPYMTANAGDPTIPVGASGAQVTDTAPSPACATPLPPECNPLQIVVGPDHRHYRIDTYIAFVTPTDSSGASVGRQIKQVMVVVRDATSGTLSILARNASTFDQSNIATA
jgi:type II secretory pathway pseudopilin PulG